MSAPKLSFIVLSYNYQDYIRTTLRSILDQTVQDFEVVVVDDCSTDASREVIRSFGDPRIRLIENERNLGGAGSYNVAVQAARGEWLVNLDADDWIAPGKCERQLAVIARDPSIDIIGGWVSVVDETGGRHARAEEVEALINQDWQLNRVETWIGRNPLCRSSSMVRRAAHLRIGLDDAAMVRAPDYELWTRALALGCRFALLHEPDTFYRLQARGVTHADPVGTLFEMCFATIRNLAPLAERRCLFEAQSDMLVWLAKNPNIISVTPREASRLAACLLTLPAQTTYTAFRESLAADEPMAMPAGALDRLGRFGLLHGKANVPVGLLEKLYSDLDAFTQARDYWRGQSELWEREAKILAGLDEVADGQGGGSSLARMGVLEAELAHARSERDAYLADRDRWKVRAEGWEASYRAGLRHRLKASLRARLDVLRGRRNSS
ncbi:glycosyltransferase family 2 protein [Sediminicoccus rosea]|uniref:Glycosyltransferase family 2 protein n=1 Tax=Sediminicoccus rosea TaxID=1225128 RepID=A0ABZ0PCC9_9PROT|nr:glycosyltransferase family 2 protein [Sediminicoccus rosea]WPB83354.1 glycosyltransferase family 2 protein [Sediminicoccus rosea]